MYKDTFGADIDLEFTPEGEAGADYEHGTAVLQFKAFDPATSEDRTEDYTLTVDPANELKARLKHSGVTRESVGLVSIRADGDPDADEVAEVQGTIDIQIDSPNVTGFAGTATKHVEEAPI